MQSPPCAALRDAMTVVETKKRQAIVGHHRVSHGQPRRDQAASPKWEALFELGESKRILESWTREQVECFATRRAASAAVKSVFGRVRVRWRRPRRIVYHAGDRSLPGSEVQRRGRDLVPEAVCKMVGVWRPASIRGDFLDRVSGAGALKER